MVVKGGNHGWNLEEGTPPGSLRARQCLRDSLPGPSERPDRARPQTHARAGGGGLADRAVVTVRTGSGSASEPAQRPLREPLRATGPPHSASE